MPSRLSELLRQRAACHPDAVAIHDGVRPPLTYAGLYSQVTAVAATLNSCGIGRDDRVAIVLPNGADMAVAFLGTAACATAAPLNPAYRAEEFTFYLEDLNARALIVGGTGPSVVREVAGRRGIPIIELEPSHEAAGLITLSATPSGAARRGGFAEEDDVALVLHTSGTTARPKMVPLTQRNLCASAAQIQASMALAPSDRCLNVMPLFHIHGLIGALLSSLAAGGSVFCTPGFSALKFLDWLQHSDATWYTAVPTMHRSAVDRAARVSASGYRSSLRFIRSCSSPLAPQLMADLERTFGVPVVEAYGMTEASHQIAINPLPPAARKAGSVGRASGTAVAIVDETGARLPAGSTGEIVIRGESVTAGYAATAEVNARAFVDGWFRTGDQGHLDAEGYLFITGRMKELINRGGEKIAPREIDEVLLLHPAIAQSVTFAAPHPTLGEDVAAAVVLREGASATARDLQEFAGGCLADFKVPRQIVFLDDLPKGPTGKLQRVGLAERLGVTFAADARQSARFVAPANEREAALAAAMAEVLKLPQVSTRDSFFDIGGDSLSAAEFVCTVSSRFGWVLTLPQIYRSPSVAELAACVDGAGAEPVLKFNEHGSRPPLVFLHSAAETAALSAEIAARCGPEQPVFVLPLHGARGEALPPTIEQMASGYVQTVRSLRPHGPYVLAGFCRSGPVALELARQLREAGEIVLRLIVIDASIENTNALVRCAERAVRLLSRVAAWSDGTRLERFLTVRRWLARADRLLTGAACQDDADRDFVARDPVGYAYHRARRAYVPRRYAGKLLVLRRSDSFDSRWLKVAPDIELAEIDGTHETCLTESAPIVCGHVVRALSLDNGADPPHRPGLGRPLTVNRPALGS
jgi:oxalate---CoA ligase